MKFNQHFDSNDVSARLGKSGWFQRIGITIATADIQCVCVCVWCVCVRVCSAACVWPSSFWMAVACPIKGQLVGGPRGFVQSFWGRLGIKRPLAYQVVGIQWHRPIEAPAWYSPSRGSRALSSLQCFSERRVWAGAAPALINPGPAQNR